MHRRLCCWRFDASVHQPASSMIREQETWKYPIPKITVVLSDDLLCHLRRVAQKRRIPLPLARSRSGRRYSSRAGIEPTTHRQAACGSTDDRPVGQTYFQLICFAPFASGDALPPVRVVARSGGGLRARASDQGFLPIDTQKYVMLLDWTGREIRENKCGAIPDSLAPILRPARARSIELGEDGRRIRPDVQAIGRSCEFGLATVVSGKDGAPSRFCVRMRIDAARRPL